MQYLLGAGGGGQAVGGFDELWLTLLSMGPLLEMDSNMQRDDDSETVTRLAAGVRRQPIQDTTWNLLIDMLPGKNTLYPLICDTCSYRT